jgi:hypothetical protein
LKNPACTLTRAVAYSHRPDGTVGISLLAWNGKPRLSSFPKWVQLRVQAFAFLALTPEESRTVWSARSMSRECRVAVWDDLLCQRATAILLESRARESAFAREAALLYGEAMDPAWVKKLRAALMRTR